MSERAMVDKGEFERVPGVSAALEEMVGCIMYLREADTTEMGEGVLIYVPFAHPEDLIDDLRGE